MRKLAGILFIVLVVGGAGFFYWYENLPTPQTSYYGVSLSDTKADVEYKLGVPPQVEGAIVSSPVGRGAPVYDVFGNPSTDKNALAPNSDFKNFNSWDYDNPKPSVGYIDISFLKSGQVDTITCVSNNDFSGSCAPILGININDTEERVRAFLGKPTAIHLEDVSKSVLYKKLNLIVMLSKQRVYLFEIGTHFDQN